MGFFSPHSGCCVDRDAASHLNEFRDLVKALHSAGIEVILDVVFNHTQSFRGIDNRAFYLLDPNNPATYVNFSGVGNTVNAKHVKLGHRTIRVRRAWVDAWAESKARQFR